MAIKSSWALRRARRFEYPPEYRFRSKFSTAGIPAGPVADRLYDEMYPVATKLDEPIRSRVMDQLNAVTKETTVYNVQRRIKPNEVSLIVVDLSLELLPTIIVGYEQFEMAEFWTQVKPYFPQWFQKTVDSNIWPFTAYDRTMTMERHRALVAWRDSINKIGVPVLSLGNSYTDRIMTESGISSSTAFSQVTPMFKHYPDGSFRPLTTQEIQNHIRRFYSISQKMSPEWTWVDIEDYCYAKIEDAGTYFPSSFHRSSLNTISTIVEAEMNRIILSGASGETRTIGTSRRN